MREGNTGRRLSSALLRDGAIQMQAAIAGDPHLVIPWSMDGPIVKGDEGSSLLKQIGVGVFRPHVVNTHCAFCPRPAVMA
jgi:hypothetical protein